MKGKYTFNRKTGKGYIKKSPMKGYFNDYYGKYSKYNDI